MTKAAKKRNTLTKEKAQEIARALLRRGASAYTGRTSMAAMLGMKSDKELSQAAYTKIQRILLEIIIEEEKHPSIEIMYAQERLKTLAA